MIYQYVVTLRNTRRRYIDRFSLLLLLASAVFFIREQLYSLPQVKVSYLTGAAGILFIVGWNLYRQKKQPGKTVPYNSALFFASIGWVTMPYLTWLFLPFALLGLFEKQAKLPLEIGFSDDAVVVNTIFRRKYKWSDFNNIVLKNDLLTLDFKNNRLLQRETIDEEGDAGEDEFNDYCRERLRNAPAA